MWAEVKCELGIDSENVLQIGERISEHTWKCIVHHGCYPVYLWDRASLRQYKLDFIAKESEDTQLAMLAYRGSNVPHDGLLNVFRDLIEAGLMFSKVLTLKAQTLVLIPRYCGPLLLDPFHMQTAKDFLPKLLAMLECI